MVRICFVCLGNICRSPTAHGIMDKLVADAGLEKSIAVHSAGTVAHHIGEGADRRSAAAAQHRGFTLASVAEQFTAARFDEFDYVLAMDTSNLADLTGMARGPQDSAKLHLFRSFDPQAPTGAGVPDPYYGGDQGFEDVLDMCEAGCAGLLQHIRDHHDLGT